MEDIWEGFMLESWSYFLTLLDYFLSSFKESVIILLRGVISYELVFIRFVSMTFCAFISS